MIAAAVGTGDKAGPTPTRLAAVAASAGATPSPAPSSPLAVGALALGAAAAAAAPQDAYLQQFRYADPTDLYLTPATPGYDFQTQTYTPDQYKAFIAEEVARTGTAGFSQKSTGVLQYTNRLSQNVAVLYGPAAGGIAPPAGIKIVRPGQTVELPFPSGAVADAQLPRTGLTENEIAVAAIGYAPFTKAVQGASPDIFGTIVQNLIKTVSATVHTIATAAAQTITTVINAATHLITTIVDALTPHTATTPVTPPVLIPLNQVYRGYEPEINVSVGGGPSIPVIVDTGSKGLAVPYTDVPAAALKQAQNDIANFVPVGYTGVAGSGDFVGVLVPVTVTIGDPAKGQVVTTAQTQVIAVLGPGTVTTKYGLSIGGINLFPRKEVQLQSADRDALGSYFRNGAEGVLGIGPSASGPGPVVTAALPGNLGAGDILIVHRTDTADPGYLGFGTPQAFGLLAPNAGPAPTTKVLVQVDNGAPHEITAIFDSGGLYGSIPKSLVQNVPTHGQRQIVAGHTITVLTLDHTPIYSYVTDGVDGPQVSDADPEFNTGIIPFDYASFGDPRGNYQYPGLYIGNAGAGSLTTPHQVSF